MGLFLAAPCQHALQDYWQVLAETPEKLLNDKADVQGLYTDAPTSVSYIEREGGVNGADDRTSSDPTSLESSVPQDMALDVTTDKLVRELQTKNAQLIKEMDELRAAFILYLNSEPGNYLMQLQQEVRTLERQVPAAHLIFIQPCIPAATWSAL